jgi:hypothetical protein
MSNTKSKKARRKKKFLMGVNEYWLIEDALMPTYTHLIDFYSLKLHEEWSVKDFEGTFEKVKEECEDGSTVSQPDDEIISTKQHKV